MNKSSNSSRGPTRLEVTPLSSASSLPSVLIAMHLDREACAARHGLQYTLRQHIGKRHSRGTPLRLCAPLCGAEKQCWRVQGSDLQCTVRNSSCTHPCKIYLLGHVMAQQSPFPWHMTKEQLNAGCLREACAAELELSCSIIVLVQTTCAPLSSSINCLYYLASPTHHTSHHVRPISVPSVQPSNPHCFALHRPLTPGQCLPPPAMPRRTRHQSRELLKKFLGQRI